VQLGTVAEESQSLDEIEYSGLFSNLLLLCHVKKLVLE